MDLVAGHRVDWATTVAKAVMWLGTTPVVLAATAAAAVLALVAMRRWRAVLAVALAGAATAVAAPLLKNVFERPRPPAQLAMVVTGGFSFPSTQAAETAGVAVALFLTVHWHSRAVGRAAAVFLATVTALVGCCMVYLGAHWPTDVLAGWCLGALIGMAVGRPLMTAAPTPKPRRESLVP